MIATIQKDRGIRLAAVLPESCPELTASAAVAHNAVAIKLENSTVAVTMSEGPSNETGMTAGKPLKVSVAQVLIYELRVRDAMTQPPVTGAPDDSLRTIQHLMKTHRISGVPILQNSVPVGLVSIEDIINALDQGHVNDPAERWMTRNIVTLRDHFSLVRAVAEFDRHGFGRFPVLNSSGALVGVITRGDITACLMQKLEKRAEEAASREAASSARFSSFCIRQAVMSPRVMTPTSAPLLFNTGKRPKPCRSNSATARTSEKWSRNVTMFRVIHRSAGSLTWPWSRALMMSSMLTSPTGTLFWRMGTPEMRWVFIKCWMVRSESSGAPVTGGWVIASRTRNS